MDGFIGHVGEKAIYTEIMRADGTVEHLSSSGETLSMGVYYFY